jgi:hypothetical protein
MPLCCGVYGWATEFSMDLEVILHLPYLCYGKRRKGKGTGSVPFFISYDGYDNGYSGFND